MMVDHGYQHLAAVSCRALWCAVLANAWIEALYPSTRSRPVEVQQSRNWFGSPDFFQVCALAGVEPSRVLMKFSAAIALHDQPTRRVRGRVRV